MVLKGGKIGKNVVSEQRERENINSVKICYITNKTLEEKYPTVLTYCFSDYFIRLFPRMFFSL